MTPGAAPGAAFAACACIGAALLPWVDLAGGSLRTPRGAHGYALVDRARSALVDRGAPWPGGRVVLTINVPGDTYAVDERDLERAVEVAALAAARMLGRARG